MIIEIKDDELLADLEVNHYECLSYENILSETARSYGYNESYWEIWKQYMEVFVSYYTLKEHFRTNYIIPAVGENYPGWWEVNFENKTITIHEN